VSQGGFGMWLFDRRTARILCTILLFAAVVAFIYAASRILLLFILAVLFAYILEPLVSRFQVWSRLSRGSRSLAIAEVYLIMCSAIAVAVILAGPRVIDEGQKLAGALPQMFENLTSGQIALQIGAKRGWSFHTQIWLQQYLAQHSGAILSWTNSVEVRVASAARDAVWLILVPILAIFFLKDGRRFIEGVLGMAVLREQKGFLTGLTGDLNEMLAHYIRSQIILAVLSAAFYMAMLSVMRLPYALAVGSVAGVIEFIPMVGPLVGFILIFGVAFLTYYHHILMVAILWGIWRMTQDYLTGPRIMGNRLKLHPLAVIFAVLVGGEIAGVIGIYLSIPIAAALRIVWKRWVRVYAGRQSNIRVA
jgi:predicted PurR-regulated permease PerM